MKDARDQLWDRARNLVKEGFEVEAYILILATWDFAYFRFVMKKFDLHKLEETMKRVTPIFEGLKNKRFEDVNFEKDETLVSKIKDIFSAFKDIARQTGASKLMALKNPSLFIMWDTEIRNIYRKKYKSIKIHNGENSEDYINFLKIMKKEFGEIEWKYKDRPFAKGIDEYNYVRAGEIRKEKKLKQNKRRNINQNVDKENKSKMFYAENK